MLNIASLAATSIGFRVSFVVDVIPGSMDPCPHCGDPMVGGTVAVRGDLWRASKEAWEEGWIEPIPISCLPCAGDEYLSTLPRYEV